MTRTPSSTTSINTSPLHRVPCPLRSHHLLASRRLRTQLTNIASTVGWWWWKGPEKFPAASSWSPPQVTKYTPTSVTSLALLYTLDSVISTFIMPHTLISQNRRERTFVRSSNFTPCCHISLPYITNFVINVNHQRSQPISSHCAMCQHVECHLLILYS